MARDKRNAQAAAAAAAGGQQQTRGAGGGAGGGESGRRRAATAESATSEEQCHPRKIFVGGLAHKTTTQQLRDHFQRHGPVVDAVVLRWPDGRSRGFGYVTFSEAGPASAALRSQPHHVGGRQVDVKRAVPGTNKLFVGGLPQQSSAAELRAHFEQFGVVSDAVVMIDPATNRSRGFGFVCFLPGQEGAEAVTASLAQYQNHRLRGKWIEVKSAAPPHKLAKEGQSEEERLLAQSSPTVSPDPSPQSAGGRPVASPQPGRAGATLREAAGSDPQKVPLMGFGAGPCLPPGLAGFPDLHATGLPPPGLAYSDGAESSMPSPDATDAGGANLRATLPPWASPAGLSSSPIGSPALGSPGLAGTPPMGWGSSCLSLNSALGAQPAFTSTVLGTEKSTLWGSSDSPKKVHLSGLSSDPWGGSNDGGDVAAPLLGRFGASAGLQKSLEELLRLQATQQAQQAAAGTEAGADDKAEPAAGSCEEPAQAAHTPKAGATEADKIQTVPWQVDRPEIGSPNKKER